ncbi:MAG TPA: DUF3870 domain-containing protein [Thermoleophilia bacterium]|nr:DUF3870 domain-containing protein [Thermoleophilia bacterium]
MVIPVAFKRNGDRLTCVDEHGQSDMPFTYLFSGYARLPQNVSHQALYERVSVVLEVDQRGIIVECSSTLVTALAGDFLNRLLKGRSVLDGRAATEDLIRARYRGHSQGALIYALRKALEAVDASPLVPDVQAAELPASEH